MNMTSIVKYVLVLCVLLVAGYTNAQIAINTNFSVLSNQPIDSRDTLTTLADTSGVTWTYPGLLSYVVDIDEFWYYTGTQWRKLFDGTTIPSTAPDSLIVYAPAHGLSDTIALYGYVPVKADFTRANSASIDSVFIAYAIGAPDTDSLLLIFSGVLTYGSWHGKELNTQYYLQDDGSDDITPGTVSVPTAIASDSLTLFLREVGSDIAGQLRRVAMPSPLITAFGGNPASPTDTVVQLAISTLYLPAGLAQPGTIFTLSYPTQSYNPTYQQVFPNTNPLTPSYAWLWDGALATRIVNIPTSVNIQDTNYGVLGTLVLLPIDSLGSLPPTDSLVAMWVDTNYTANNLRIANGSLLYYIGNGTRQSPDYIWQIIDDISYDAGDTDWEKIIKKINQPGGSVPAIRNDLPNESILIDPNNNDLVIGADSLDNTGEIEFFMLTPVDSQNVSFFIGQRDSSSVAGGEGFPMDALISSFGDEDGIMGVNYDYFGTVWNTAMFGDSMLISSYPGASLTYVLEDLPRSPADTMSAVLVQDWSTKRVYVRDADSFVDSTVFSTLYALSDTSASIRNDLPDLEQMNTALHPIYDTDYYLSAEGDDGNSGSKSAPIQTIAEIESRSSAGDVLNFRRGDQFRDEFDIKTNQSAMTFTDFHGNRDLARISVFEPQYGWTKNGPYSNIYYKNISHSVGTAENYNNIYVIQIDGALWDTNPYDAVTFLTRVDGMTQCDTVPGTFYATSTSANPITIQMHTIDSANPDSSIYRYEVVSREFCLDGYARDSFYVNGLYMLGAGDGYGMASGGDGVHFDRCIFDGGSTHHTVIKSGVVENSLFTRSLLRTTYPSDFIAVTFYEADASGNVSYLQNCAMYDLPSVATYSHSSGSGDHELVVYRRNKIFNTASDVFGIANTNRCEILENYVSNCDHYYHGVADSVIMADNVIVNQRGGVSISTPSTSPVIDFQMHNNFISCTYPSGEIFVPNEEVHLNATGNIFYAKPTSGGITFLRNTIGSISSYRNIFVMDGSTASSFQVLYTKGDGVNPATNYEGDYNVYIKVAGSAANTWTSITPTANYSTLAAWTSGTGHDANSIFIDLSSDSDGLKEVFIDPDNGDWRLNSSGDYYDQIMELGAGMTTPPVRWLQRPTTIHAMVKEVEDGSIANWNVFTPLGGIDDQLLTFDTTTNILTIEGGNTVDLSSLSEDALITPHYDGFDLSTITPVSSVTRRDTVDFNNQIDGYFRVNLASLSVHTELVFLNPHTTEVPSYRLHLDNPSSDTIIFPENLLLHNRDTVGTRLLSDGCLMRIWYDGTNYFSDDTCGVETEVVLTSPYTNTEFQDIVTHAVINGYTLPADSILMYGDSLITRAKANGWWSKLDIFMCLASPGSKQFALIDWVDPGGTDDPAEVGTMTWTAGTGMTGGGSTSNYIQTNYAPSTDAVNFAQNSATFGGWITNVQSNGTSKYVFHQPARNYFQCDNTMVGAWRVNHLSGTTGGNASASLPGLVMGSRTASGSCTIHHNNGTAYNQTGASSSTPLEAANFTIFSATTPSNATVAFFFAGSNMDGQKASIYADLDWFLSKL